MSVGARLGFFGLQLVRVSLLVLVTLVASCGGDDPSQTPQSSATTATVGAAGGTVTGPDGVQVVIPAGALDGDVEVTIRRNPSGAPAPLQEGNAPLGPVYEFAPHDVIFKQPVVIRIPLPAGAATQNIFMASFGEQWDVIDTQPTGQVVEFSRNSFSFSSFAQACSIPPGNTDPYICSYPRTSVSASAIPSTAITQVAPSSWLGQSGSWVTNQSGIVSLTLNYSAAPDCAAPQVKLVRFNSPPSVLIGNVTTVLDQAVALTVTQVTPPPGSFAVTGGGGPTFRGEGSTTVNVSAQLADAINAFRFTFSCQRPGKGRSQSSDLVTIKGPMVPSSGPFSIGGTVSGLTGTGLVLQNNGGNDLGISANGQFVFGTTVPGGNPYAVSVKTQPSGQFCGVQNGVGTANTDIDTVLVTCFDITSSNVAQLVAGPGYSCIRYADNRVKCWGWNNWAQLGLGDMETRGDTLAEMGSALPFVNLGTGRTAIQVQAGHSFKTCAILDNGSLKCWGNNGIGSLGLGVHPVSGSPDFYIGDSPSEMGDGLPAINLGTGRTAVEVAIGDAICARLDDASVKCWGDNWYGQGGQGSGGQFGTSRTIGDDPAEMGDNLPALSLGAGRTAVRIRAGFSHICALLDDQRLKCWGYNDFGQLGLGDTNHRGDQPGEMGDSLPTVNLGTGRTVVDFGLGSHHTCALLDNGAIKCWGWNIFGQLGLGDTVTRGDTAGQMGDNLLAVNLGTGRTAVALYVGGYSNCALLDDDTVKCWGANSSGDLGLGDTNHRGDEPNEMGDNLPVVAFGTGRVPVEIAMGSGNACARLDDGTIKCWGENTDGMLGLGDFNNRGDNPGEMGDALPPVNVAP